MASAEEALQFLEGEVFQSQQDANKGQLAVKRSSTLKSTKRRTLAKEHVEPKSSDNQVFKVATDYPEALALLQRSCSGNLKEIEDLDPLLLGLQIIEKVLEEEEKQIDAFCSQNSGINCLLKLLAEVPSDADVATESCWILANVSSNRAHCDSVVKGSGCGLVIAAMKRHNRVSMQHAGLAALCNMAIVEEHRSALCDEGILYAVVNSFDVCRRSEWVVFTGAQVVQNISGTGSLCIQIVQARMMGRIRGFVEFMADHEELLQSVCWTVSCVAFASDDDNRVALYEDGAANAVTLALESSPHHKGIQFTGLSALSNLCRAELLISKILDLKAVDLIHLSLTHHERHQGIQAIGLRTLVLLSSDESALATMSNLGLDSHCKRVLREFAEGPVEAEGNELLRRIKACQPRSNRKSCLIL